MSENNQALVTQDYGIRAVVNIDEALRRHKDLQRFVQSVMVEGEDYGVIPGTGKKPTLLKPGAEKLCEMYGLAPTFDIIDSEKDWESPFFYFEIKCSLVAKGSGIVVAEGLGACNSRERRYRNQDQFALVNTILKMAKKRAHVDATLSATRSSGSFTEDLEDMADDDRQTIQSTVAAEAPRPTATPAPKTYNRDRLIERCRELIDKSDALDIPVEGFDPKMSTQELLDWGTAQGKKIAAKEATIPNN